MGRRWELLVEGFLFFCISFLLSFLFSFFFCENLTYLSYSHPTSSATVPPSFPQRDDSPQFPQNTTHDRGSRGFARQISPLLPLLRRPSRRRRCRRRVVWGNLERERELRIESCGAWILGRRGSSLMHRVREGLLRKVQFVFLFILCFSPFSFFFLD